MKNFLFSLVFFVLFSCNQISKEDYDYSVVPPVIEKVRDTLFNFGASDVPQTKFFMVGRDISEARVVGVVHNSHSEIPGVSSGNQNAYHMFWRTYFDQTKKDPQNVILAIESTSPTGRTGAMFLLSEPQVFVTKYLFDIGLRKVVYSDSRDKSMLSVLQYRKAGNIFSLRGGITQIDSKNIAGFPVVRITKEPSFTKDDSLWVQNVWYQKCYLPSHNFEDTITKILAQRADIVAVVGAAHAMHLFKDYGVKIVLPLSVEEFNSLATKIKEEEYLLRIARK